jgi:hypothetical protein
MRLSLIIGFILISCTGFAQNWEYFKQGWKYNYQVDTAQEISETVHINSVGWDGFDSVYYFNQIAIHCQTCSGMPGYSTSPNDFIESGHSNFVGNSFSLNGDSILFNNGDLITQDSTFPFRSWSAVLTSLDTVTLFNSVDSVKTYAITTGGIIQTSKSFGILTLPDQNGYQHNLVGIEGDTSVGEIYMDWSKYFNFNAGDVLQYQGQHSDNDVSGYYAQNYFTKIRIDSIVSGAWSTPVIYGTKEILHFSSGDSWGNYSEWNHNTNVLSGPIFSATYFTNYITAEHKDLPMKSVIDAYQWESPSYAFYIGIFPGEEKYMKSNYSRDQNGKIWYYFGTQPDSVFSLIEPFDINGSGLIYDTTVSIFQSMSGFAETLAFSEDFGFVNYSFDGWHSTNYERLIGIVRNGDTTGTIHNDEYMYQTGIDDLNFIDFSLFPNPSDDFTTITFNESSSGTIVFTNLTGQQIDNFELQHSSSFKLNTAQYPSGLYLINFTNEKGTISKKLLINH